MAMVNFYDSTSTTPLPSWASPSFLWFWLLSPLFCLKKTQAMVNEMEIKCKVSSVSWRTLHPTVPHHYFSLSGFYPPFCLWRIKLRQRQWWTFRGQRHPYNDNHSAFVSCSQVVYEAPVLDAAVCVEQVEHAAMYDYGDFASFLRGQHKPQLFVFKVSE